MQGSMDQTSPNWIQIAFGLLAAFLGGGGAFKLLTFWLQRKKLPTEIHESIARTVKTTAEARRINVGADVELNAIIERLHSRIDQMQLGIDAIRGERDELSRHSDKQEMELESYERQMRRMKAIMDLKGIRISDFDEPRA
jgi:hypothetical protein